MALNLKLAAKRSLSPDQDRMGRDWVGWDPTLAPEVIFERNRGIWFLGPRAERERYVTFSVDGHIRLAAEIDEIVTIPPKGPDKRMKSAVVGRVLEAGDPAFEFFIGRPVDSYRNPVSYIDDPDDSQAGLRTCACGCGMPVSGHRDFVPGHDQRAVHERITRQWGNTLGFIEWFDATYPDVARGA